MKTTAKPWTDDDVATLERMVEEGALFREIDVALQRRPNSSASKFANMRAKKRFEDLRAPRPAPVPAAAHTSLTALICGDPLPGRSALDQRRGP